MAAEILEGIEGIRSRLAKLNASGLTLEVDSDLLSETGFNDALNNLDIPYDDFYIEGNAHEYHLYTSEGRIIDLDAVYNGIIKGDFGIVMDELKISKENLSEKAKNYIDAYKKQWKTEVGTKSLDYINEVSKDGNALAERININVDVGPSELEKALNENSVLKTKFNEDLDALKKKFSKNSKVEVGKWINRGIILTTGLTLADVWRLIMKHKQEMNGCWLINKTSGEKCKINTMSSCSIDKASDKWGCENNKNFCASEANGCFAEGTCIVSNEEDGSCKEELGACVSDKHLTCSKLCEHVDAPENFRTHCVNVNFWGATNDFFHDVLPTKALFSRLLLYIGIPIAIIIFAILINKLS